MGKIKRWIKKTWEGEWYPILLALCAGFASLLMVLIANGIFAITNSQLARVISGGIISMLILVWFALEVFFKDNH